LTTRINGIFITEALELFEMGRYELYQSFAKIYEHSEYNPPNQVGTRKDYWQNKW